MRKERAAIVTDVIDHLRPAETNLDLALSAIAMLNGHLPYARLKANLALEVLQPAISAFGEAQQLLILARAKVVEGHKALAENQRTHFPEVADGGLGNKDPRKLGIVRGERPLAVVGR